MNITMIILLTILYSKRQDISDVVSASVIDLIVSNYGCFPEDIRFRSPFHKHHLNMEK